MTPGSAEAARDEAEYVVRVAMRSMRPTTREQRIRRIGQVAEIIWTRWRVGIRGWQHKHVLWVLDVRFGAARPHTRYQIWLAVRDAIRVLRKGDWERILQGNWVRPTGEKGPMGPGRKAKVQ